MRLYITPLSRESSISSRAFTLIELLVVMGIVGTLMGVTLVAVNPARQFCRARNTQRLSDLKTIDNAIQQHVIDGKGAVTLSTLATTMSLGSIPVCSSGTVEVGTGSGNANLSYLVSGNYVPRIPYDPSAGSTASTGYAICAFNSNTVKLDVRSIYFDNSCLDGGSSTTVAATSTPTTTPTATPTPPAAGMGSAYIGNSGTMTIYGTAVFSGMITTARTSPVGVFIMADGATQTGVTDSTHVDGYVRKYGTGAYTYPIGSATVYRPIGISTMASSSDSIIAAYFAGDPGSASLPSGAPFSRASLASGVTGVSPIEYWDIDGTPTVNITLTWNATSDIATLTSSDLSKLTIVGWNGTQWVAISSTAVGGSSLTSGSITSSSTVAPNTYNVYALGKKP